MVAPKYQKIIDQLRHEILSGQFRPGTKLPSEQMLVKRFDTSRITVARALRELQNAGLIERVAGSGSFVRLLEKRAEGLVFGLLIPDLGETEVFDAICQGIANAPGSEHALLWGHADGGESSKQDRALALCEQFMRRKVAGVFFAPLEFERNADKINRRITSRLLEANVPVVLLDRRAAASKEKIRLDLAGINNWQAGYTATEYLIKSGCRRIGFLGYHAAAATISARMAGYRDALREYDLPECSFEEPAPSSSELDAFVCINDLMAAQLMQSLLRAGTRIPDDIRVVGIDDVSFASLLPVPLTTVRQPCREIGEAALRLMLDRLDRPKSPVKEILFDGQLIARSSA